MSQSKKRRKFQVHTKTCSLRHLPCHIYNLLTAEEQTQACTTNAAHLCQQLMAEEAAKAPQWKVQIKRVGYQLQGRGCSIKHRETALKTKTDRKHSSTSDNKKCTKNPTEIGTKYLWMPKSLQEPIQVFEDRFPVSYLQSFIQVHLEMLLFL